MMKNLNQINISDKWDSYLLLALVKIDWFGPNACIYNLFYVNYCSMPVMRYFVKIFGNVTMQGEMDSYLS